RPTSRSTTRTSQPSRCSPSRSSSCRTACSVGRTSRKSDMRAGAAADARIDFAAAAKDAGVTALLCFFLLLPLIGFKTIQNIHNEIALEARWPLLLSFVAIAAIGRLLYALTIAPWRARRALRKPAERTTPPPARAALARWFAPFVIGFVLIYPPLA